MPAVSVIIPTYNRAELLGGAIASVLNQAFQDFEILVVDDGSTDHTSKIVRSFGDKRITFLRRDVNEGVSRARNLAIGRSTGEYVAFLDDDDEWLPEKLELQVRLIRNCPASVGGVYTGFLIIDRGSGLILDHVLPNQKGDLFEELCIANCVGTASTVLLRKDCIRKVGWFDEKIFFGEEYDLWIRVAKEFQFECIQKPLVIYHVHGNNTNSNYGKIVAGKETQLEKHWPLLNQKALSHRYLQLGDMYCYHGNAAKGREALLTAIKLYPFEIKHYYDLCLSLIGHKNFKRFKELKGWVSSRLRQSKSFHAND